MNDLTISKDIKFGTKSTQGAEYAKSFISYFQNEFDARADFKISKKDFDTWLVKSGFSMFFAVPNFGTPEWSHFVAERNQVRTALNNAAKIGQHGEPPFTVNTMKAAKEHFKVVNLTGMISITYQDAVASIQSLSKSKGADIKKMSDFFLEQKEKLPIETRLSVKMLESQFSQLVSTMTFHLNNYAEHSAEIFNEAQLLVEADKAKQLEHKEQDSTEAILEHLADDPLR